MADYSLSHNAAELNALLTEIDPDLDGSMTDSAWYTGKVSSTTVTAIVSLTQAAYNALSPPVSTTLYLTDEQHIYLGTIQFM